MSDDLTPPDVPPKKRTRGPNKNKGKRSRKPRPVVLPTDPAPGPTEHARVVAINQGHMAARSTDDYAALQRQISELTAQLDSERTARTDAEAALLAAAEAQGMLMQRDIREVPTGRTVTVQRATGYKVVGYKDDGREIHKPEWGPKELPTYFYKVDLPPVGGIGLKRNGETFYHGATYELDIDTLRSVKEIVFRCWKHDSDIHGSDENAYRPVQNPHLSGRGMRA